MALRALIRGSRRISAPCETSAEPHLALQQQLEATSILSKTQARNSICDDNFDALVKQQSGEARSLDVSFSGGFDLFVGEHQLETQLLDVSFCGSDSTFSVEHAPMSRQQVYEVVKPCSTDALPSQRTSVADGVFLAIRQKLAGKGQSDALLRRVLSEWHAVAEEGVMCPASPAKAHGFVARQFVGCQGAKMAESTMLRRTFGAWKRTIAYAAHHPSWIRAPPCIPKSTHKSHGDEPSESHDKASLSSLALEKQSAPATPQHKATPFTGVSKLLAAKKRALAEGKVALGVSALRRSRTKRISLAVFAAWKGLSGARAVMRSSLSRAIASRSFHTTRSAFQAWAAHAAQESWGRALSDVAAAEAPVVKARRAAEWSARAKCWDWRRQRASGCSVVGASRNDRPKGSWTRSWTSQKDSYTNAFWIGTSYSSGCPEENEIMQSAQKPFVRKFSSRLSRPKSPPTSKVSSWRGFRCFGGAVKASIAVAAC